MLVHEPAQIDEQLVRVGLLQSRAVELFQTLGGLLVAQAHAVDESLDTLLAGTHVEFLSSNVRITDRIVARALSEPKHVPQLCEKHSPQRSESKTSMAEKQTH